MSLKIPWYRDIAGITTLYTVFSEQLHAEGLSFIKAVCVCVSVVSRMAHIQYVEVIITDPA